MIQIDEMNAYGLDIDLDPRSMRFVQSLGLMSNSLTLSDYRVLSMMDFRNLVEITLSIKNIYECELFQYLLEIVKDTTQLVIFITNEKAKGKTLNDKCLAKKSSNIFYMKNLNAF